MLQLWQKTHSWPSICIHSVAPRCGLSHSQSVKVVSFRSLVWYVMAKLRKTAVYDIPFARINKIKTHFCKVDSVLIPSVL